MKKLKNTESAQLWYTDSPAYGSVVQVNER